MRILPVFVLAAASHLIAGPLSPPAGPVSPTHKTMTEVEPRIAINPTNTPGDADSVFRISQPGSYYLTANIDGVAGKSGMEVASSNVTIDLNGFVVSGAAGALFGITGEGFGSVTIRNGILRDWPSGGTRFPIPLAESIGIRVEHVSAISNGGKGFESLSAAVYIGCVAVNNSIGFDIGDDATLQSCAAFGNTLHGFSIGFGSTLHNCISRLNGGDGYFGAGSDASLIGCTATLNSGDGFDVGRSTLASCTASFNDLANFNIRSDSSIIGCTVFMTTSGTGISAASDCSVRDNNVSGSAGSVGILVTGSDNRVEGNNVSDCTTGFSITGAGNLIIRNSASGGTTRYSIVAGNAAGPIVTTANVATNTIPTANFDY